MLIKRKPVLQKGKERERADELKKIIMGLLCVSRHAEGIFDGYGPESEQFDKAASWEAREKLRLLSLALPLLLYHDKDEFPKIEGVVRQAASKAWEIAERADSSSTHTVKSIALRKFPKYTVRDRLKRWKRRRAKNTLNRLAAEERTISDQKQRDNLYSSYLREYGLPNTEEAPKESSIGENQGGTFGHILSNESSKKR